MFNLSHVTLSHVKIMSSNILKEQRESIKKISCYNYIFERMAKILKKSKHV